MELLYLWIEDYRNIYKTGFNFSPEYQFTYHQQDNKLEVEQLSPCPKLFNDSFYNITLLLGQNGSGKSSLFYFLISLFEYQPSGISSDYVIVLRNQSKNIEVYSKNPKKIIYSNNTIQQEFNQLDNLSNIKENIALLFYSNSFTLYDKTSRLRTRYSDFSTFTKFNDCIIESERLLVNRFEEIVEEYKYPNLEPNAKDFYESVKLQEIYFQGHLSLFYSREIADQLRFISTYRDKFEKFIPSSIEIQFNAYYFKNNLERWSEIDKIGKLDYFNNLLFERDIDYSRDNGSKDFFKECIVLYVFLFIFKNGRFRYTKNYPYKTIIQLLKTCNGKEQLVPIIKEIIIKSDPHPGLQEFKEYIDFINGVDDKVDKLHFFDTGNSKVFRIEINKDFLDFFESLASIWVDTDFILYMEWVGLSAGESALLSVFSRLNTWPESQTIKTIWLLLDEFELYLHPEWQRTIFNNLHQYLPKLFPDKKIQLILSSHSPFIASDLPKENIILLKKGEHRFCELEDKSKLPKTFGANIHELLTESFFMQDGLIGEFARLKIAELIEKINLATKLSKMETDEMLSVINLIGEPFIRSKLSEMVYAKAELSDSEKIEKQIELKEKELEDLKKLRHQ
jgi:hypothetical protein